MSRTNQGSKQKLENDLLTFWKLKYSSGYRAFVYRCNIYVLSTRIENRYCSHKIILHAIFTRARSCTTTVKTTNWKRNIFNNKKHSYWSIPYKQRNALSLQQWESSKRKCERVYSPCFVIISFSYSVISHITFLPSFFHSSSFPCCCTIFLCFSLLLSTFSALFQFCFEYSLALWLSKTIRSYLWISYAHVWTRLLYYVYVHMR